MRYVVKNFLFRSVKHVTVLYTMFTWNEIFFLALSYSFFQMRQWLLAGRGTTSSKRIIADAAKAVSWSISRKPHSGFWDCNSELKRTFDPGDIFPWNAYGPYVKSRPPRFRTSPALWNRCSVHLNAEMWIRLMFKMKSTDCFPTITERQKWLNSEKFYKVHLIPKWCFMHWCLYNV